MTAARAGRRVAFFVFAADENTLGRAFSLWLTAEALGWESRFVAPRIDAPWPPLASEQRFLEQLTTDADGAGRWADVLVALKPWPGSLDVALRQGARYDKRVVLDVDDPDFEAAYGESLRRQALNFVELAGRGKPPLRAYRLRYRARTIEHVLISNPALQRWYGRGTIVPHTRVARAPGRAHSEGTEIEVAFVGTVADHKGIGVLRRAAVSAGRVRLVVTADAPPDALPHERWIGRTSLADGLRVIDRCDVVVIASQPWTYGAGQLPAKLIDAMMAGRAVVASALEPIRWALDGSGLLVAPGDVGPLVEALQRLRSPVLRAELGERARARALSRFTPDAIAPAFAAALA
jgi:glycosyltransferase involved in cell wall biosynthesis